MSAHIPGATPQPTPRELSHTPFDNTVYSRLVARLAVQREVARGMVDAETDPHAAARVAAARAEIAAGLLPRPDSTGVPTAFVTRVEVPSRWKAPERASRYLRVVRAAGDLVLGETNAKLGSDGNYSRSSMVGAHKTTVETTIPHDPTDFASNGTWAQFYWQTDKVTSVPGVRPDAPMTKTEHKAVGRMQEARRDAAVSAGLARRLRQEELPADGTGAAQNTGLYGRWLVGHHERRFRNKMRKAGNIANGKDIRGRLRRLIAR